MYLSEHCNLIHLLPVMWLENECKAQYEDATSSRQQVINGKRNVLSIYFWKCSYFQAILERDVGICWIAICYSKHFSVGNCVTSKHRFFFRSYTIPFIFHPCNIWIYAQVPEIVRNLSTNVCKSSLRETCNFKHTF